MGKFEQNLAEQIVKKSLALRRGEEYYIDTWQHTIPMAEALWVEAAKVGAYPHLFLFTDEAYKRFLVEVPDDYIGGTSKLSLHAYDSFVTATTSLGGPEDPAIFDKMPAERMNAMQQGIKPIMDKSLEKKIRGVYLAMGTVTPQRAEKYGINFEEWSRSVRNALKADLTEISKVGSHLATMLEGGRKVRITAENGTNLSFDIQGRKAFLEDGIVDADDIKKGAYYAALPAGTVSMAPRETTANGRIIFDKVALWGKVLTNVEWNFRDGRMTEYSVGRNRDTWEKFYGPATGDKDRIGSFSLGLNPKARPLGISLADSLCAGVVSIGIGDNAFFGGSNKSPFEWSASVVGATVELDGKQIVKAGKLA